MKKVLKGLISLVFAVMVLVPMSAFAATDVATYDELKTAVSNGGEIKLSADVTVTENLAFNKDTTLDLNGYKITAANSILIPKAVVTIKDTSSAKTGTITNAADVSGRKQLFQVGASGVTGHLIIESGKLEVSTGGLVIYNYIGDATINGGTIYSDWGYALYGTQNSKFIINGGTIKSDVQDSTYNLVTLEKGAKLELNDGELNSTSYGIASFKDTEVTINGGSIKAYYFTLSGNGSSDKGGDKFTINGGTLTSSNAQAIYIPQIDGVTKITGGTITGTTGIEIRAGKLEITGGTFTATAVPSSSGANGNGSTTVGAAVAIAQHTTKKSIDVKISGGTFNGYVPVSEANPQGNSQDDLAQITLSITGGTFNTTNGGTKASASEDFTKFITGGTYTKAPDKTLLADDYTAYKKENGDNYLYVVDKKSTIKVNKYYYQLSKGESAELDYTIEGPAKDYATFEAFGAGILSLEGNKITGLMSGETDIAINLNDLDDTYEEVEVYVYALDNTDETSEGTEAQAVAVIKSAIDKVFSIMNDDSIETYEEFESKVAESIKGISLETLDNVMEAIADGETVLTEVSVKDIAEEISDEDKKLITDTLKKDETVIGYFDINFLLKAEDEELGNITELESPIKISLDIPSNLPELKDKYVRTYYVVRIHDGETTKLETQVVDGKIVFETDKFSTYALAYTDTVKNPQTGDNIMTYMIALFISLTGIASGVFYLKKSKSVKNN